MYAAQAFSRSSTATVSPGLRNIDPEIVCVGDEHGLQDRFQQAIGQVLPRQSIYILRTLNVLASGARMFQISWD